MQKSGFSLVALGTVSAVAADSGVPDNTDQALGYLLVAVVLWIAGIALMKRSRAH